MTISAEREVIASSGAKKNLTRLIVATSRGDALEWFDISVCAYFAVYLAKAFNSRRATI